MFDPYNGMTYSDSQMKVNTLNEQLVSMFNKDKDISTTQLNILREATLKLCKREDSNFSQTSRCTRSQVQMSYQAEY